MAKGTARGRRRPLVAERRAGAGSAKRAQAARKPGARKRAPRTGRRKAARGGLLSWPLRLARWLLGLVWALAWRGAVVVALLVAGAAAVSYATLPDMAQLADGRERGSVTLTDRNGEIFAWRGEQYGGLVTADSVSPHLVHAVVATEDRRFYRHLGVSPRGIAGAIRINLAEGRGPLSGHGGSTITQQVAKLLCLGREFDPAEGLTEAQFEAECRSGSVWRKIREIPYAFALEAKFTKDEILAIYLNRAYLGAGAQGFAAAARRYFGTSVAQLDPSQAAMLAGLLVAPSYYAPTNDLTRARERAQVVLGLMRQEGYLSATEHAAALASPARLSPAAGQDTGGAFADWVMREAPSFLSAGTTEDVIARTTFDARIQRAAEAALAEVFETKVRAGSEAQAAIVVMSADGAVRAMVGGRDTRAAGLFNRAVQAERQTGSAFKPFVYAAALDLGWRWDSPVLDGPLAIQVPGSGTYAPTNYSGQYYGEVTLTEALARSLNTAAVRLSENVGRDIVRNVAGDFGVESDMAAGPALALGVSESTLLEMTGAYAGILNGGTSVAPYGLSSMTLRGDAQAVIGQSGGIGERVISDAAARQLTYMMSRVIEAGTGTRADLGDRPAAGKTGTTQAARDAWFIGFTGDYVAGVWMGYDDNTPLAGVTGGGLPAEIWRETMLRVHEGLPIRPLPMGVPGVVAPLPQIARTAPAPLVEPAPRRDLGSRIEDLIGGLFGR
jgi:membrane peptidoglycan carboxypeptidase